MRELEETAELQINIEKNMHKKLDNRDESQAILKKQWEVLNDIEEWLDEPDTLPQQVNLTS